MGPQYNAAGPYDKAMASVEPRTANQVLLFERPIPQAQIACILLRKQSIANRRLRVHSSFDKGDKTM